jgi:hypothetical protein
MERALLFKRDQTTANGQQGQYICGFQVIFHEAQPILVVSILSWTVTMTAVKPKYVITFVPDLALTLRPLFRYLRHLEASNGSTNGRTILSQQSIPVSLGEQRK